MACSERNYAVSFYVAEFFNSLSSAWIIVYALIGMARDWHDEQRRFFFLLLAVAGCGSLAFHGTLHYVGQLADELPMVYIALTCFYCVWVAERPRTDMHRARMVTGLVVYAGVWSWIHAVGGYTTAFQVHFGVCLSLVYTRCFWNAMQPTCPPHVARLIHVSAATLGSGFILWILDQQLCVHLHSLPASMPNPQLHAWWHVGLASGAFYANHYFAALRATKSGFDVEMAGNFLLPRFTSVQRHRP